MIASLITRLTTANPASGRLARCPGSASGGLGKVMGTSTIEELRERVRGSVITAEDEGYEEARRVYNAMIDKRPAVIVRPANAGDVIAAVDFAREND